MTDLARLHAQLDRIEAHIETIKSHGASVDITLALQHAQLVEHIKRTALLEKELQPISKHVQRVQGAGQLLAVLAIISTIVAGFAALWSN
jgi:hypothetical protein